MDLPRIETVTNTDWTGQGELWLDPLGDEAHRFACTARLEPGSLSYTWAFKGAEKTGRVTWLPEGGQFLDSFHQETLVACQALGRSKAEVGLTYEYPAPPGPNWGWHIFIFLRPNHQLVLQMTNVAPWGEEVRATRMVFERP